MTDTRLERTIIDLAVCDWQFGHVPQQPWSREPGAFAPYDLAAVGEWLPATIPGNVRTNLLAAGRIPDPFMGDGLAASRWVEGVDWWYRTRLPLGLQPGQQSFLELDGVDYLSAVFVDGQELSRHEGLFSRQVIEIPPDLAAWPTVELAVRLWGSDALPRYRASWRERVWARVAGRLQTSFQPFDDRLATLKAPMHFGWDFAPRLRTMGIWDEARAVVCEGVYLADVWVQAEPLGLPDDPGPARLRVQFTVDAAAPQPATVHMAVRPRNFPGESWDLDFEVTLPAGRSEQDLAVVLPAARLWQPWERGGACVYELQLALLRSERPVQTPRQGPAEPTLLDAVTTTFGVRTVEVQDPWRIVVNGQPFFLRGANWAPVDALWGRARRASYESLLVQAQQAGLNFLRVWGGGGREKAAFYELCDELGLLVWQEFPIACVFLDHLPSDPGYLRVLRSEATGMARALRNHPSLFLWCGGNEFSPGRNRPAVQVLAEAVAAEDGTRPWVPASPGPGDAHNWLVWHGQAPLAAYRREKAAMVSEFGLQAAPNVDSLRRFLAANELWPPGAGWERHKADLVKLRRYVSHFRSEPTSGPEQAPDELRAFVEASQRAQAAGLQVMIEHVRRRRGGAVPGRSKRETGGVAVWQWNDPWPAISWSVIDYFGQPKQAYDVLRRIMLPVMVSLAYPLRAHDSGEHLTGALWLVNDTLEPLTDCQLRVFLDDNPVHEQTCAAPACAATPVGALQLRLPASFSTLRLELHQRNWLIAENVYDLRFHDAGPAQASQKLRRRLVDRVLR